MAGLRGLVQGLIIKRPARRATFPRLAARLVSSGERVAARCARAAATDEGRARLRHIVGIERWGHRRLGTILGEPPVADEYDTYRPDAATDWPALREAWATTRAETVALAGRLAAAGVADERTARHNEQGDLAAREWLIYLNLHTSLESLRIR